MVWHARAEVWTAVVLALRERKRERERERGHALIISAAVLLFLNFHMRITG